jgi:hypothetical protein
VNSLSFSGDQSNNNLTLIYAVGVGYKADSAEPSGNRILSASGQNTTMMNVEVVSSFLVKTRAQYLASLPMRFQGTGGTIASFLANFLDNIITVIVDLINGKTYIQADFSKKIQRFSLPDNATLTPEFTADLAALPPTYAAGEAAYRAFIDKYGTHVMTDITWGGRLMSSTTAIAARCGNAEAALQAKAQEMVYYSSGVSGYPDTIVKQVAGGPVIAQLYLHGLVYWRLNLNMTNAIPVDVEALLVNDHRFVSDENKRVALAEAIDAVTPWELPIVRVSPCIIEAITTTVIVLVVVFLTVGIVFLTFGAWWFFRGRHRKAAGPKLDDFGGRQANQQSFHFDDDAEMPAADGANPLGGEKPKATSDDDGASPQDEVMPPAAA